MSIQLSEINRPIAGAMNNFFRNFLLSMGIWFVVTCNSSCSNDHESESDTIFETEFEKNYREIANQNSTNRQYLDRLLTIKKSNFDAYRSIAFTWHSAAIKTCTTDAQRQRTEVPLSSYQQLLDANKPEGSFPIDSDTRECIHAYFINNLESINAMINLN